MVQCLVVKKAFKHTGLHLSVIYSYFEAEIRSNEQIHIRFIDHNIQSSGAGQPETAVYEQGTFCHVYNSFFNISRFTTYCILH